MTNAQHDHAGSPHFALWLRPRAGLPNWAAAEFAQRLDDYLTAHDLDMDVAPEGHMVLRSDRRSLGPVDQVDLLEWIFEDDLPAAVRVGPLTAQATAPHAALDGSALADRSDLALQHLTWLYRAHRLSASQFLQILGDHGGRWMPADGGLLQAWPPNRAAA